MVKIMPGRQHICYTLKKKKEESQLRKWLIGLLFDGLTYDSDKLLVFMRERELWVKEHIDWDTE